MKLSGIIFLSIFINLPNLMVAQNSFPEINGFKSGNIEQIQEFLAETLTIDIETSGTNKPNIKKSQAIEELKIFFESNTPTEFKIIHTGERNNSSYVIGKLSTNKGEYRITVFLKKISDQCTIDQIKIEVSN